MKLAEKRAEIASIPTILMALCLAAQMYLLLFKSFNWDEFLHFSQVYQLRAGTLNQSFQVLHARILWWAPEISDDLIGQMRAARFFMWCMQLVTLCMIYGVARQFTGAGNAAFAAFAYLTAGYVFSQGFSIRADPIVTATLMSALFLLVRGELGLRKSVAVGALIGLAAMMTVKALLYAPCFAGLAWLKGREAPGKAHFFAMLATLALSAGATLGLILLYHTSDIGTSTKPVQVAHYARWISAGVPYPGYIRQEILLAPLFFLCVIFAPLAWTKSQLTTDRQVALTGFIVPLVALFFYRNTFPYFFVFLLAPVAIALAPVLGLIRDRFGSVLLSVVLSAVPLGMAVLEPRDVLERQKSLIDYVHREYPAPVGYLDYSGMIADYPRVLRYLTSGIGMASYYARGEAIVAREIDRGNLPFIIANHETILAALENRPVPGTFLPADLASMKGNYVRQWGMLWREGTWIPAGPGKFAFDLRRGGKFVLAGETLAIDGATVVTGSGITLQKGPHVVSGGRSAGAILWRGTRLPGTPPNLPAGNAFTNF